MIARVRRRPATPPRHRAQTGVTLVELAVTVSVIGVLGVLATTGYSEFGQMRARTRAQADAEAARHAIRAFALRNKRLPCPDLSADGSGGREGSAGSCPTNAQVGWLPYESLGLAIPDEASRMRYAVGRAGGADLVAPVGDASDGLDLDGAGRLRTTLGAAARLPKSSTRPFLTGRGTASEPENCAGHVQSNPAFVLVAPVGDRDDAGGARAGFDGVNHAMAASANTCIASPGRAMDVAYDDVVVAESASALLGWLAAHTR